MTEQEKDKTLQQIEDKHRNAIVYIEAFSNSILLIPWLIKKFFKRSKSVTYTNWHNLFTRIHKDTDKDAQKTGVAGTGFFVAPDLLVTNIHVVAKAKTIAAKQQIVKKTPVYHPDHKDFAYANKIEVSKEPILYSIDGVKAYDESNDLVLLKVNKKCTTHLHFGNSDNVKEGDRVYTVAYNNAEYKCLKGVISGRNEREWFEIKTQYSPGYSGSPVLNSKGEIIGIACLMARAMGDNETPHDLQLGSAIPSNHLNSIVEETGEIEAFTTWQKRPRIKAYTLLGQATLKQAKGKNRSAVAKYNRILKLNPDIIIAYSNRGVAKSALGNYVGAIEDYDISIGYDPNYASAYYNRGSAKRALGEKFAKQGKLGEARRYYQDAIEDHNQVINRDPKRSMAHNNRGWTMYLLGQIETEEGNESEAKRLYQQAISDANEAIRLHPEGDIIRSAYFHTRGAVKAALGENIEAIEDYDESIRLNPKKALLYQDRGIAKRHLGQMEDAEADFAKAKELDPDIED